VELPLVGAGGEPVDLRRTLASHGVASLAPQRLDEEAWVLETTLAVGRTARTIRVSAGPNGGAAVESRGGSVSRGQADVLLATVRHMLRLDDDLTPFYALVSADPELAWASAGAGRMLRSPTVFEDVVKTVCTTNCAWSATERMTGALVTHLGGQAPGGHRTFPTPAAMAEADESFYRDVVRAGYRGPYLRTLAAAVAAGELDLEALADPELPEEEVAARLLALPGVGPYAAAHVMTTALGRYRRLILDSWTRPQYVRVSGRKASDRTIERRFRRYGDYAGLAFWLYLTKGWVPA
jgi:3-methyladenine DNA glycosylase/8-oxoguanine DNA glycosylase